MSLPILELGPQEGHFKPLTPLIPLIRIKAIESTNARNTTLLLLGNRRFGKRLSLESGIWMKEGAAIKYLGCVITRSPSDLGPITLFILLIDSQTKAHSHDVDLRPSR